MAGEGRALVQTRPKRKHGAFSIWIAPYRVTAALKRCGVVVADGGFVFDYGNQFTHASVDWWLLVGAILACYFACNATTHN